MWDDETNIRAISVRFILRRTKKKNIFFFEESNEIKQFYGIFNACDVEARRNSSRRPDFMQCAQFLSSGKWR